MQHGSGVSLIELLIVIAIIGVLAAVAVPSFSESVSKRRLDGIANELSTDLQYTRSQAISTNANVSLVATATGYSIGTVKTVTLDARCSLAAAGSATLPLTLTFEANRGTVNSSAGLNASCTGTSATLRVLTNAMGTVQICSPNGTFGGYVAC